MGAFYNTFLTMQHIGYCIRTIEMRTFFCYILVQISCRANSYGLFSHCFAVLWKYCSMTLKPPCLPCGADILLFFYSYLFVHLGWKIILILFFTLPFVLLLHLNSLELFLPSFKAAGEPLHPLMYIKLDTCFPVHKCNL